MTDEELLDAIEAKTLFAMLQGCAMDDHLGRKEYDPRPLGGDTQGRPNEPTD